MFNNYLYIIFILFDASDVYMNVAQTLKHSLISLHLMNTSKTQKANHEQCGSCTIWVLMVALNVLIHNTVRLYELPFKTKCLFTYDHVKHSYMLMSMHVYYKCM